MKWFCLLLLPGIAFAKVKTEKVVYEKNGARLEGFLAFNDKYKNPRPGVVVFHNWMGITAETEKKTIELAELGYVAFAGDIYGQGVRPKDENEASKEATSYKDNRTLMRERARAAFDYLSGRKEVLAKRIGAIGFCFGGTVALELARAGTDFKTLVSFHGGLSAPVKATTFSPKVLILHGGDDPYVGEKEVLEFQAEMRNAKADWQFVSYGNTVHSFTEEAAGNDNGQGAAYNAVSHKRAFNEMKHFFSENL